MKNLFLALILLASVYISYGQTIPPIEQKAPMVGAMVISQEVYNGAISQYKQGNYKGALKRFEKTNKIYKAKWGGGPYYPSYYAIGVLYWEGKGVKQNKKKAIEYFKKAAAYNYPQAAEAMRILDRN